MCGSIIALFAPIFDIVLEHIFADDVGNEMFLFSSMRLFKMETFVTIMCYSTANKMAPACYCL